MVDQTQRVREIEATIRKLRRSEADYLRLLARRFGLGESRLSDTDTLKAIGGLPYVRDRDDGGHGLEVIRHPYALLKRGGDCEDWNLLFAGGMLAELWGPSGLQSEYLPSIRLAKHVRLRAWGVVVDLVPPRGYDLTTVGEVVTW